MKERVRSVLECEGDKEIKEGGGGSIEIGWTRAWRIKTRKKRKKKWKLMDENESKEKKNNIKIKKIYLLRNTIIIFSQ